MDDLLPAPLDFADLDAVLLPSRACLLAVMDTLVPARRTGLEDAVGHAHGLVNSTSDQDAQALGALECLWEATACLELAASVAAPWVDPRLPGVPAAYVEMARYDPTRATRFYQSSRNWTDERFKVLSGHHFRHGDDETLLDFYADEGVEVDNQIRDAFEKAEAVTARFLRDRFTRLVFWWESMSPYAAAFEHAALLVPTEFAEIQDGDAVLESAFTVFETRRNTTRGHIGGTMGDAIEAAALAGNLAADLAEYVVDARLRVIDAIEFRDGAAYLKRIHRPFAFWCRKGDLSAEVIEILQTVSFGCVHETGSE